MTINGPVQASASIESNAAVSTALSLLSRGGSKVVPGNLLTLPVAERTDLCPALLRAVHRVAGLSDPAGGSRRLWRSCRLRRAACDIALTNLFGGGAGNSTTGRNGNGGTTPTNGTGTAASAAVQALIKQASDAFANPKGRWRRQLHGVRSRLAAGAGRADALVKAGAAKATPSASASPTASSSASPKPSAAPPPPSRRPPVRASRSGDSARFDLGPRAWVRCDVTHQRGVEQLGSSLGS